MKSRLLVASTVFLVAAVCVSCAAALLSSQVTVPASGKIKGVGVSVDPASLVLGELERGGSVSVAVSVVSTGNKDAVLSMETVGLPAYLSLTWNCSGYMLPKWGIVTAEFVVSASADAPFEDFTFDVIVTASE